LSIKFDCTVIYAANNDFVPFAEIFFLEGADTVFSGTANEEGNIKFELLLDKRKVWRMAGQYCKFQAVTTIHKPEDSVNYHFDHLTFNLDLALYSSCNLHDPNIYYDMNDTETPTNIYPEELICSFSDAPNLKLEYSQIVSKKEKPKITRKRIEAFKEYLLVNQLVPPTTTFSYGTTSYLKENEPDQRARIQLAVISFD
jgi:hypothetical protein